MPELDTILVRLEIVFGALVILTLAVNIAGLHMQDSLGAFWYQCLRSRLQRTFMHNGLAHNDRIQTLSNEIDGEYYIGLNSLDSVNIPSAELSFDEIAL